MDAHATSRPAAVLRHEMADGSVHFDLLLDALHADEGPLITFRCSARPDEPGTWTAERTPDHRRTYLTYEGPISSGRGAVRRVWSGSAHVERGSFDGPGVEVRLVAGSAAVRLRGQADSSAGSAIGRMWRFITEVAAGR